MVVFIMSTKCQNGVVNLDNILDIGDQNKKKVLHAIFFHQLT
jgi:hypothetical protein